MSFFRSGLASDPDFVSLRDGEGDVVGAGRDFVEALWEECQAFVDSDLPTKAQISYIAAFWELYLSHALLRHGVSLVPRSKREPARHGPDLLAADPRVWLEATAPTPGEGTNAVTEARVGEARAVPDDQIILRYRTAISDKIDQFTRSRARGWIKPGDATVIALNGSRIPSARAEITIPRIVRSVLPFGHETFHIDINTMRVVDRSFGYRPLVTKHGGAPVSVDFFRDDTSSGVSAVLASCADEINRPEAAGSEFVLVHNPFAECPLPRGWLPAGCEYWVEGDRLHETQHNRHDI